MKSPLAETIVRRLRWAATVFRVSFPLQNSTDKHEGRLLRSHLRTLALKTWNLVKTSVVLVKRKNGFTKTIPWTETLEK